MDLACLLRLLGVCQLSCVAVSFTPSNKLDLEVAVEQWLTNATRAEAKYGHISSWDTSMVTDMSGLFRSGPIVANLPIGNWNTGRVTNMSRMFYVSYINAEIGSWNTANVVDMSQMFMMARYFDSDIGGWNTAN
eukprot:3032890-Amphidinium_carterae.1